jgi:hypothetical protein
MIVSSNMSTASVIVTAPVRQATAASLREASCSYLATGFSKRMLIFKSLQIDYSILDKAVMILSGN